MATAPVPANLPTVEEIRVRRRSTVFLPAQVAMSKLMRITMGEPIPLNVDLRPWFEQGAVVDVGPGPHRFKEPAL